MSYELLIQNIRFIKSDCGLSFVKMAKKMGIKDHTIEAWIHRGVHPTNSQIEKISYFAKISIDDLCKKDISRSSKTFLLKRYKSLHKLMGL